ncbi:MULTISPECIES: cell division protein SepF [Pseudofrankia]|uniref:cell division protein SepF n=1 Tax=Pseudofrankia TaxID=2994363 RepID=UPI0012FEC679|nr:MULTISPECIES: cell division protein SepF [Pseudofrankia]
MTADSADDAPFFEIHKYGDLTSVAVAVRGSGAVIVDFRSVDDAMGRRVADFCAGLGFGIGNSPFRLTDRVYFLSGQRTPNRAERARFAG